MTTPPRGAILTFTTQKPCGGVVFSKPAEWFKSATVLEPNSDYRNPTGWRSKTVSVTKYQATLERECEVCSEPFTFTTVRCLNTPKTHERADPPTTCGKCAPVDVPCVQKPGR